MDPISFTASVIAILQLNGTTISLSNGIKSTLKERARCAVEVSNLYSLLTQFRYRLEDFKAEDPWFKRILELGRENRPFNQVKLALENLKAKLSPEKRYRMQCFMEH